MSLKAYQTTQRTVEDPRDTEYRIFGQVTHALIEAKEKELTGVELLKALDWNRSLWRTLASDCSSDGNGLPKQLRAQIVSLAIFVSRHSSMVMRKSASIDSLIDINRMIMQGLQAQSQARAQAAAQQPQNPAAPRG